MDTLSRRGRELIKAARERPGAADRDRIRRALDVRLAAIAAPALHPPSAAPPAAGAHAGAAAAKVAGALGVGAKVITGVLLVGFSAGVLVGRATAPTSAVHQSIEVPAAIVAAPAPVIDDPKPSIAFAPAPAIASIATPVIAIPQNDPTPQVAPKSSSPSTAATGARVSGDIANPPIPEPAIDHPSEPAIEPPSHARSIAEETAALREAHAALQSGDANAALAKLDDLGARFPTGALQEERRAARVLALCAAGRAVEARAEADKFLTELPGSVQAARVRASCAYAGSAR